MSIRLDSVCDIVMGQAPSGDSYNTSGKGLPLLAGAGDFKNGLPVAKKFTEQITKKCLPGDIVLGIRASIGDMVLADREYCLGRGVAGLRPRNGKLDARFLWHWLSSIRPQLEAKSKGATFKQVNREDVSELSISLPSLDEQRRIAAVLDKAEELRAKRRAAIALLDQLPQAIFLEKFGASTAFPLTRLDEACNLITDGTHYTPTYSDQGVVFLSAKNVTSGSIDWDSIKYIPESLHLELQKRVSPRKGDLLLAKNGTTGVAAIVDRDTVVDIYVSLALLRCSEQLMPEFLHAALNSDQVRRQFHGSLKGIGVPNLHLVDIRRTQVPLPPLDFQRHFAARIEAIHRAKSAHQSALTELDALFASLQDRAFGVASRPGMNSLIATEASVDLLGVQA